MRERERENAKAIYIGHRQPVGIGSYQLHGVTGVKLRSLSSTESMFTAEQPP